MATNLVELKDVSFSYDQTSWALENVSIEVLPQEFIAIFGPNGGGKTTLLKLILGLLKPSQGEVLLLGNRPEKTRHRVGYVPQRLKFDKEFPITVLDVVFMGALQSLNWLGRYPQEVQLKAESLLEQMGLTHRKQALFGSLSGGEAQRALMARALLSEPELLILDEPTAHVDDEGERHIYELLQELNKKMTIVTVTHDLQTTISKASRLICVQTQVTSLQASNVCEHFALGLYHTPLAPEGHFANLRKRP